MIKAPFTWPHSNSAEEYEAAWLTDNESEGYSCHALVQLRDSERPARFSRNIHNGKKWPTKSGLLEHVKRSATDGPAPAIADAVCSYLGIACDGSRAWDRQGLANAIANAQPPPERAHDVYRGPLQQLRGHLDGQVEAALAYLHVRLLDEGTAWAIYSRPGPLEPLPSP